MSRDGAFTEAHIHILPNLDDGSSSVETSIEMLKMLMAQGVKEVIATPHYYHHRETNLTHFLEKRARAHEKLRSAMAQAGIEIPIRLGAEIAIERGISEVQGVESLVFTDSDIILLEFPYDRFQPWMTEEIYNISVQYRLKVMVAHIHRYLDFFTKSEMEQVLSMDVLFQVNHEAFGNMRERRFVNRLLKEGYPVVFGSDSHNLSTRKPNWDLLAKKCKAAYIESANQVLAAHLR